IATLLHPAAELREPSSATIWLPEPSELAYQLILIEALPEPESFARAEPAYQLPGSSVAIWYSHFRELVSDSRHAAYAPAPASPAANITPPNFSQYKGLPSAIASKSPFSSKPPNPPGLGVAVETG